MCNPDRPLMKEYNGKKRLICIWLSVWDTAKCQRAQRRFTCHSKFFWSQAYPFFFKGGLGEYLLNCSRKQIFSNIQWAGAILGRWSDVFLDQRSTNLPSQWPDSKYFRFCKTQVISVTYSSFFPSSVKTILSLLAVQKHVDYSLLTPVDHWMSRLFKRFTVHFSCHKSPKTALNFMKTIKVVLK